MPGRFAAPAVDLSKLDDERLILLFGEVMAAMRKRGIVRSANNPIADIAERLVAEHFGGELAAPNEKGYDVLADGRRLQVKALRMTQRSRSTLSAIRSHDFDAIVAVVFENDMRPRELVEIPLEVVEQRQAWSETWKAHRLSVTSPLLADPRVRRITADALLAD
jgi:Family of unknown function (DUF6998)